MQDLLDFGKALSTIKVNLAAISACRVGFVDSPVGQRPLIKRIMKGAHHLHFAAKPLFPS